MNPSKVNPPAGATQQAASREASSSTQRGANTSSADSNAGAPEVLMQLPTLSSSRRERKRKASIEHMVTFSSSSQAELTLPQFRRGVPISKLDQTQQSILTEVWACLDAGNAQLDCREALDDKFVAMEFNISSPGYVQAAGMQSEPGNASRANSEPGYQYEVAVFAQGRDVSHMMIDTDRGVFFIVEYRSNNLPRQYRRREPAKQEHIDLMAGLPKLRRNYYTRVNRFLCYLEVNHQVWSSLMSSEEVEKWVKKGIKDRLLYSSTRKALAEALLVDLPGQEMKMPKESDHINKIANLSQDLTPAHRSVIIAFFRYLESHDLEWSKLVPPDSTDKCPKDLNNFINEHINRKGSGRRASKRDGLHDSTRRALNLAFGLNLQGAHKNTMLGTNKPVRVPLYPIELEHKNLMNRFPDVAVRDRLNLNRFLCFLEASGKYWSDLVAQESADKRPRELEKLLNDAIENPRVENINDQTRTALNNIFGFELEPEPETETDIGNP